MEEPPLPLEALLLRGIQDIPLEEAILLMVVARLLGLTVVPRLLVDPQDLTTVDQDMAFHRQTEHWVMLAHQEAQHLGLPVAHLAFLPEP